MTVPHIFRIGALVIATTAFYGYVGQMVPQKEVQPPQETVLRADLTTADMVQVGRQIMEGKGLCFTCHTIGKSGALRFPDLDGVDARAKTRATELGLGSDVDYFAQTMYEPDAFIVPGFNPGMPTINKPPIGLTDQEILCVMAYLQSLGGTPTVTLQTTHRYRAGGTPPGPPAEPAQGVKPNVPGPPKKGALRTPAVSSPAMERIGNVPLAVAHQTAPRRDGAIRP
jgi:mono/diheme cytochrome c family protein